VLKKAESQTSIRNRQPKCYGLSVASKPISAFISLETGHHAFAFEAIDWNVSGSMPGIFTVTVRWSEVMEKPSPSFSMTTTGNEFGEPVALRSRVRKIQSARDAAFEDGERRTAPCEDCGCAPGPPSPARR